MAHLSTGFPGLDPDTVQLYYSKDPLMESLPVLIFYGPSTTGNATRSNSRIQAHIYALAGFQSFPRLTIAPTSPLYAAVNHLPSDRQGDEVSRGLAISLLSYFAGLTGPVKDRLKELAARRRSNRLAPAMFDEMHAGQLATEMVKMNGATEIIQCLSNTLSQQSLSWIDIDVVLPPKTIQRAVIQDGAELIPACGEDGLPLFHYGQYGPLINQIGHPAFLPTSKLKRAPSRPTAHSKSKTLSKDQKISIRREMCEVLDTEKSYVAKLKHLVGDVAVKFRQSLHEDTQRRGLRIGDDPVARLFPESLSRIVTKNGEFLLELEEVLSATEDAAIQDIEGLAEGLANLQLDHISIASWKRDPTGTLAFAKVLLKWLPKFSGPYQDYMRTSVDLPNALCAAREDSVSELSRVVNEFGEQRLRSVLIEPVQRLPRYNLLIDNIISQLPASHPAMSNLLKSKDVVADICALESCSSADTSRTSTLVRKYVRDWPSWLSPRGRLTTAVDAIELDPPYGDLSSGVEVLILLFPDTVIIARKENGNASLGAKGMLAEVDRPTMNPFQYHTDDKGLSFSVGFDLSKLHVSEFANDRAVRLMYTIAAPSQIQNNTVSLASDDVQVKVLSMLGAYEGRAHRFSEDIIKARIEGRFSEPVRESDKWALRTIEMTPGSLGMFVAMYQQDFITQAGAVLVPPRIRVDVGIQGDSERSNLKNGGVEITSRITPLGSDAFRIDVQGFDGSRSSETSTIESLGRIMVRKFMQALNVQSFSQSHLWATSDVSYNHNVLRTLPIQPPGDGSPIRSFRPLSPIKLVSHLFGGSTNQAGTPYRARDQALKMKEVPPIPPPKSVGHVGEDQARPPPGDKLTMIGGNGESAPDPLAGLELTLNAYIVALRSRSGNIVGKILRNRAAADELLVNELYNILIEDPSRVQAAAEVSVDVLFAAFEKFLGKAWQERMGSLLTPDIVATMISGFELRRPVEFSQQVRKCLENMSPQNRRAFSAAVKLLSDLLEASGNDGDRGALMASFTEILVPGSNSHDCITLFDRLVDDYETLFDENCPLDINGNPDAGSVSNYSRNERSNNTGSWSSNASSLKKRFGFGGLSRENSKSEPESKVASVWRTLSKNARSPGDSQQQPVSLSKGSLFRSKSTDLDVRMLPPIRPISRDKPTPPNASPRETSNSRPTSSHLNMSIMSTIGEGTPTKAPSLMKKKRRSSLSDLKSTQQPADSWLPLQPRKLPQPGLVPGTPPRTPSSNKHNPRYTPSVDYSQRFGSPERFGSQRRHSPQRFGSPQNKENSPGLTVPVRQEGSLSIPRYNYKKPSTSIEANEVKITSFSPKKRTPSSSGISATRGGLSERTWPPNVPVHNSPTKPTQSSPQKLRIQSPQKLRERLSNEQKALSGAESSLQAEIAKIGEEMSVFKLSRPDTKKARPSPDPFPTADASTASLESRLASLSMSLSELASDLRSRHSSLSKDIESSLLVNERKSRKLDDLYKEANAENEALYDRFNDELGKVLSRVKGGEGIEELKRKVKEGEQEQQRLKKENARLKREVVGLRSQLS
ncbi:MAG: hypothetical protein L6R38_001142 [Xanthoria sp. 2 TBL-2021]|nr:MAG: hypothetical protein L6R38_001142 [Xanthoria sp. 2 TBL-2021]